MRPATLLPLCAVACCALAAPVQAAPGEPQAASNDALPSPAQLARKVDALMEEVWRAREVTPAERASDAELLRRVSLDLIGVIPDEASARAFLADGAPDKHAARIRELLSSPAFARTQALRWSYLLVGREYLMRSKNVAQVRKRAAAMDRMRAGGMEDQADAPEFDEEALTLDEWLTARLQENAPWDQVASALIAAEGQVDANPAAHYMLRYARDGMAAEMTGSVMRVFQGQPVQCAQCHDHPYDEEFSQRDFWGLAAFFTRTAARRLPPTPEQVQRRGDKAQGPFQVYERPQGQARLPAPPGATGALVLPRFTDGTVINPGASESRRAELARLITRPDNPLFARAAVNRIWSFAFGRGLVDPVDEVTALEECAHPDVLALLAADFRRSGCDVRRLWEVVVSTRAYQLSSSGPEEGRDAALELFARAPLRSMSAEQLFTSVLEATGAEGIRSGDRRVQRGLDQRRFQLLQQFLRTFGDDEAEEVVDEGTIPQALMLLNGPLTNEAVRPRPGHPVYDRLFAEPELAERITTIYLRVLSRPPSEVERAKVTRYLSGAGEQGPQALARAYADVFWALLNSSEFNLIH